MLMKELTIQALIENIPAVTDFVEEQLAPLHFSRKAMIQLAVAIDEIFSNIAKYAYDGKGGEATVRVETEAEPEAAVITFIDNGEPFDPLAAGEPDLTLDAEERKIGGLGIFLVKKSMDGISYEYKDGHNILRIKKKPGQEGQKTGK